MPTSNFTLPNYGSANASGLPQQSQPDTNDFSQVATGNMSVGVLSGCKVVAPSNNAATNLLGVQVMPGQVLLPPVASNLSTYAGVTGPTWVSFKSADATNPRIDY